MIIYTKKKSKKEECPTNPYSTGIIKNIPVMAEKRPVRTAMKIWRIFFHFRVRVDICRHAPYLFFRYE